MEMVAMLEGGRGGSALGGVDTAMGWQREWWIS